MNVKLQALLLSALVGTSLFAEPGTYKGKGTIQGIGSKPAEYAATLVLKEITPKALYEVQETWDMGNGQKGTFTHTFHFNQDGTFKVKRNNVEVGCGYSFDNAQGHWMDYKVQSEQGPVHINQYYSKVNKQLVRMGDGIFQGTVKFWTDSLAKE